MQFDTIGNIEREQERPAVANQLNSGQAADLLQAEMLLARHYYTQKLERGPEKAQTTLAKGNTYFLGTTIFSSSGVNSCVNVPGTKRPGVS